MPSGGARPALLPDGRSLNTGGQTGNEQENGGACGVGSAKVLAPITLLLAS
jgi:hypothetical protein